MSGPKRRRFTEEHSAETCDSEAFNAVEHVTDEMVPAEEREVETVWGSASKTGLSAGLTGGPEPGWDSLRPPLDSLQDHLWSISTGSSQKPSKGPSKPTSRTLSRTFLQTFLDLADLIYRPPFGPLCIRTTSSASSLSPKNSACYCVVCCVWWRWSGL